MDDSSEESQSYSGSLDETVQVLVPQFSPYDPRIAAHPSNYPPMTAIPLTRRAQRRRRRDGGAGTFIAKTLIITCSIVLISIVIAFAVITVLPGERVVLSFNLMWQNSQRSAEEQQNPSRFKLPSGVYETIARWKRRRKESTGRSGASCSSTTAPFSLRNCFLSPFHFATGISSFPCDGFTTCVSV